jgi:hypothetical protein
MEGGRSDGHPLSHSSVGIPDDRDGDRDQHNHDKIRIHRAVLLRR